MKKIIFVLSSLLVLFALPAISQKINNDDDEKYEFTKENKYTKTYSASGNKLKIENSFGAVKFIVSDKNEIRVNIHILTGSNDKDNAQRVFDAISVTDKQEGNTVSFVTNIKSKDAKNCKNCKSNMKINYEVFLPSSTPIDISNSFGGTEIPNYSGELEVTSKFGNLKTGNLSNLKSVAVEFGKGEIGEVSNIDGKFKFSDISIKNLSGDNKISLEFCNITTIDLDPRLTGLVLSESYSTVNLRPAGGLGAQYKIETSFGKFLDRTNSNINRTDKPDQYGPDADKSYSGQTGNGAAKITMRSSFGKIILGNATAEDMQKGKESSKSKPKNNRRQI